MKLFDSEIKTYVVQNTMGDGRVEIRVKFVYLYYLLGKVVKKKEVFDQIKFDTYENAEMYLRYAISPSEETDISVRKDYVRYSGTPKLYKVKTLYDSEVHKMNDTLQTFYNKGSLNESMQYDVFYVCCEKAMSPYMSLYSAYPTEYAVKQQFVIADSGTYSYIDIDANMNFVEDDMEKCFNQFTNRTNQIMRQCLDKEKKERLSNTLIKFEETQIKKKGKEQIKSNSEDLFNSLDESRNQLIKDELRRVSEYTNFLKSLLR